MIVTERLTIAPFDMADLPSYVSGFNAEITRYQWPDPFESIEDARPVLQEFLDEMEQGETLFNAIHAKEGAFLGSVEIHGLSGDCPELGVWIVPPEQGKGYAFEALSAVLDYARATYGKTAFYYEADIRNTGSLKLLRKLGAHYDITEQGLEQCTTDSGKELALQGYVLKAK